MITDEYRKLYFRAMTVWGSTAQIIMVIEEMGELIVELTHYLRNREFNVEEEIADVMIMLEQLSVFFDENEIARIKQRKLKRLEERVTATEQEKGLAKDWGIDDDEEEEE